MTRCHICIWPHDPGTRCVRARLHGGTHVSESGLARQSTAAEAMELLGLGLAELARPITDIVERLTAMLSRLLTRRRSPSDP